MSRLGRFVIKHRFPRREIKVQNDNPCAKQKVCSLEQCTNAVPINSSLVSNTRSLIAQHPVSGPYRLTVVQTM